MYIYESPVGLFTIQEEQCCFVLRLDGEILGRYASPNAAANDVYLQSTGSYEWDDLSLPVDVPTGIAEWSLL